MYQEIIIKVLTSVPIFKDISRESIVKLASLARLAQFSKGDTVFNEGDPGDCLYIIASGKADITTRASGGEEIILKSLGPGEVFGEIALLDGLPRSAGVRVTDKSILFYINRTDFTLFLTKDPEVSIKLVETLSRRLRETNNRLRETIDENDQLKILLQETYSMESSHVTNNSPHYGEEYSCPFCSGRVRTLKVKTECTELLKTDDDFCPHYRDLNPLFYEIAVCPGCGYAFSRDFRDKIGQQEQDVIRKNLSRLGKPKDFSKERSLEQAIETFYRASVIYKESSVPHYIQADVNLKLAWLYRYLKDREMEVMYTRAALQEFRASFEEEGSLSDIQKDLYIMYMIGQLNLNSGETGEALKWFSALAGHNSGDQAPELVTKARSQWQAIKQRERSLTK
ncbi:MAG: DUF2225 domain-containing protein [Bacillota bacterium]